MVASLPFFRVVLALFFLAFATVSSTFEFHPPGAPTSVTPVPLGQAPVNVIKFCYPGPSSVPLSSKPPFFSWRFRI